MDKRSLHGGTEGLFIIALRKICLSFFNSITIQCTKFYQHLYAYTGNQINSLFLLLRLNMHIYPWKNY